MNNKFSWQSFISIGLLFSFIVMLFSGLILYVAPEGSLSRWIGWDVFNLTKKQWEHQHTIFSYLFVIFSIFHIFRINWSLMLSYFVPEKIKISNFREIIIALLITIIVFIGTLVEIDPFNFILKLGNNISDSYSENVERPKVADAEKLTIAEFSEKVFDIPYAEIHDCLINLGFIDVSEEILIKDFCKKNDITPEELYKVLKGELMNSISDNSTGALDISSISSFIQNDLTIL